LVETDEGEALMLEKIEIFRMASAMMSHAGTRQTVIAQNIANADTPGYRARDVLSFKEQFQGDDTMPSVRATRASHLHGTTSLYQAEIFTTDENIQNPNGNSVSLEVEMMKAVDVQREHERAVAIYKSSLGILRSALGR